MAHFAVAWVAPAPLRAHCRVADVAEILITAMNAVNHQVEAVTLGQLIRSVCIPSQRRIVAKNAHLHLVAVIAVEGERRMALIAGSSLDHRSPRLYR